MKKVIIALKIIGAIGITGFWGNKRFFCLFLFYLVAVILEKIIKYRSKRGEPEKPVNSPVLTHYYVSMYLSLLNPLNIILLLKQLLGQLYILVFYGYRLPSPSSFRNKVQYRLPFKGAWAVGRGGVTADTSHSWDIYTQRYAYDFFMMDDAHKPCKDTGKQLDDYYCFNQDVIAPADGTIISVKNNIADYSGVGDLSVDWKSPDFRGNFVIIKHADQEYSFIAHFRCGSISVKKGDIVKQGQFIGKCGNSGHSTMPHIHFHLQNSRRFWIALGLPVVFNDIVINGVQNTDAYITGSQLVSNNAYCIQSSDMPV
ncbi:M23 family metallopeptidase [Chitinophaga qingshengii]|uniref:M23 family metallopeptidase n=1 Tax=Chitinophaga qingshengii TaxID=1569794 RepID=A0ABR7TUS4_9BACT|nr:M23 family metallopeptidase [Chitinophaga qingshengii]MBC9934237.1 M23 family metallopeptidase [Chitinophaga qingshengii]